MAESPEVAFEVRVQFDSPKLRVVLKGLTNHLLRGVLLGLWATLDDADRTDLIAEMAHYDCGRMSEMPPLARLIAASPDLSRGR